MVSHFDCKHSCLLEKNVTNVIEIEGLLFLGFGPMYTLMENWAILKVFRPTSVKDVLPIFSYFLISIYIPS